MSADRNTDCLHLETFESWRLVGLCVYKDGKRSQRVKCDWKKTTRKLLDSPVGDFVQHTVHVAIPFRHREHCRLQQPTCVT